MRRARLEPHVVDATVACSLAVVVAILIAGRQESGAKDPDVLAFALGVALAAPRSSGGAGRSLSSWSRRLC
jgi:hypothetical protein